MTQIAQQPSLELSAPADRPADAAPPIEELVIEPPKGWVALDLRELWRYREMIRMFTLRDITARYKQSLFGPLWIAVTPLLSAGVFGLIFGALAGLPSGDVPYPVFVFAGMLAWGLFARAFTTSSNCLMTHQHMISKVYYPRLVSPISASLASVLDFVLGFGLLTVLLAVAGIWPGWPMLAFPLFALLALLTGLGCGIWLSALSIRIRDVRFAGQLLPQIWMWLTPVAWSSEILFESDRLPAGAQPWAEALAQLNPMYVVVEGFRWSTLGTPYRGDAVSSGTGLLLMLTLLVSGLYYFRRVDAVVADVI